MRRTVATLLAAVVLSACAGGSDEPRTAPSPSANVPVATAKPKVTKPSGPAPKDLVTEDITVGTGAAVIPGQVVSVHYVLMEFDSGKEVESSWASNHPFQFTLGGGDVIEGWDKGLLGMRVGGRRQLVIPPRLGYGEEPDGALGGKTLVFVVDVVGTGGAPAVVDDQQ
ncbi:MAG TPA: FKBP-type peptidyl-prolyl cis-trans isomerase [Frankiaceae bacterium]|nr:FKBP-type peptidyl-prolyl cis-trans isomerase [Frankiaceae bacterium]